MQRGARNFFYYLINKIFVISLSCFKTFFIISLSNGGYGCVNATLITRDVFIVYTEVVKFGTFASFALRWKKGWSWVAGGPFRVEGLSIWQFDHEWKFGIAGCSWWINMTFSGTPPDFKLHPKIKSFPFCLVFSDLPLKPNILFNSFARSISRTPFHVVTSNIRTKYTTN